MGARVIQVIETDDRRGRGVDGDPVRLAQQYFTFDGALLFERDLAAPPPDLRLGLERGLSALADAFARGECTAAIVDHARFVVVEYLAWSARR